MLKLTVQSLVQAVCDAMYLVLNVVMIMFFIVVVLVIVPILFSIGWVTLKVREKLTG